MYGKVTINAFIGKERTVADCTKGRVYTNAFNTTRRTRVFETIKVTVSFREKQETQRALFTYAYKRANGKNEENGLMLKSVGIMPR